MDNPPFYRKTIPARNLHDREDFPAMLEKTGGKSQRYFHYITIIYIYASYYYYIPLSSLSLLLLSIKPIIITYYYYCIYILVGGFNPSEKDSSIGSIIANIYGKLKHVPNHQLDNYMDSK